MMNKQYKDIEFVDYQNRHEFLIKLAAYEVTLFEEECQDFPFYAEILSTGHHKVINMFGEINPTKNYLVRIHNLLINEEY